MSEKINISTKKIWEFTTDDTIYIPKKVKSTQNNHFFLCQFERLVNNTVYGKVLEIDKDTSWDGVKVGDTIYNEYTKCCLFGASEGIHTHFNYFNTMGYAFKDIGAEETESVSKHPSYGMIGLTKRSSNKGTPLFGSNIQHSQTICLSIKRAVNKRQLNNDYIHAQEELIEVVLSGSQFAELITSFGMGDGVPCTIRHYSGHNYPDPPYENPMDIFQREFSAKMKNIGAQCESLVEDSLKMLKEKQTISKGDRDFLMSAINQLISQISSNTPHISQQFTESMERTVSQAKMEIETFVSNRINSLGIDAAKTNPNLFLSGLGGEQKTIEE